MQVRLWRSLTRPRRTPDPRPGGLDLRYVREPDRLVGRNEVTLLRRGEQAYPAMLAEIAGARRQVHFETYILRSDRTGQRFRDALVERARAGVEVRVMFDSVGSYGLVSDRFLQSLAEAGIDIVEYHPVTPWRRSLLDRLHKLRASTMPLPLQPPRDRVHREPGHWSLNRRDHQKILVIDERVAFTGGINIGDEYAPSPEGGGWHDLHVRIEGPAALGLASAFRRAWLRGDGDAFPEPPAEPDETKLVPALAHTCDNFGLRNRSRMHSAYRHAIRHAKHSIVIANAYFIPDQLLIWALKRAAKRGVVVRVIVPARSDVRLVALASRYLFGRLLRAGVRIFEYHGRMMHAKAAAIDGTWATIGSFNIDRRSMLHNLEAGVVILDREFTASLERQFESDFERCREVDYSRWRRRRPSTRFLQWFAHLFSYWL